ncbi:hypothetical protein Cabys_3692 [Caldithrix abyssi DSM 13497]|uniref:Uncharacterized protein n=1 Tax=Caldithrix abyssi DSM 13497 TaxID=880073 RepID=A0A1J1CD04_CALAY|nr:hypothetical protein Cabys_3692 [Caldithrix abyssi DSM 13497]
MLNFGFRIICLIFFCDYWRNLLKNYFARVSVGFGWGYAAFDLTAKVF